MQNRAKLLIRKLKDHSDVISSNDNRQLLLEGFIVPNSNIVDLPVDLVNDVVQKRKGVNPEESSTFSKSLPKINVPEDFVRNPDRLDSRSILLLSIESGKSVSLTKLLGTLNIF